MAEAFHGKLNKLFDVLKSRIDRYNGSKISLRNIESVLDVIETIQANGYQECTPVLEGGVSYLHKHLSSADAELVHHTLILLDFIVKKSGFILHGLIGRRKFMKTIAWIVRKYSLCCLSDADRKTANAALDCVQKWNEMFFHRQELYPHFYQTHIELRDRYHIPFREHLFDPTCVPAELGAITETERIVAKALGKNLPLDYDRLERNSNNEPPRKLPRVESLPRKPLILCEESAPVYQPEYTCAVCLDAHPRTKCFGCAQMCGTFVCWECLRQSYKMATAPGAIQSGSNAAGELLCCNVECRCAIRLVDLVRNRAPGMVLKAQEDFKLHVHTAKKVSEALRQQESQIRGEYARIEQIKDADEKAAAKMHLKIVDEVLTLRCLRCHAAFIDFDGCFAVNCANNSCGCGFCAWCLKDCCADAHDHVITCPENIKGSYFDTFVVFQQHHKMKQVRAIQVLLQDAALSRNATEKLKSLIKRDLEDLKIWPSEVFSDRVGTGNTHFWNKEMNHFKIGTPPYEWH